jgi:hypothetical protein
MSWTPFRKCGKIEYKLCFLCLPLITMTSPKGLITPEIQSQFCTWHAPFKRADDDPNPRGKRTENRLPWANSPSDFFWVEPTNGASGKVTRIWSRSMIEEVGGTPPGDSDRESPEPSPLQPWPLLKFPEELTKVDTADNASSGIKIDGLSHKFYKTSLVSYSKFT